MGSGLRTASLEVRDRLAFTAPDLGPALRNLVQGRRAIAREAVVLSTCHRTEIYALTPSEGRRLGDFLADRSGLSSAEIEGSTYLYRDRDAVNHLFRVAAGLDSAILGEAEVLGQVRHALRKAQEHRAAGSLLIRLFETALRVGKRVRTETAIARQPLSLSHVAVDVAERAAGDLSGLRLLVVGAGKIGEQTARHLAERCSGAVRIINRDPRRASRLARIVGGQSRPFSALGKELVEADVAFLTVHARGILIDLPLVERAVENRTDGPLVLVDLGLPRNVAPAAVGIDGVLLYNIDDLADLVEDNLMSRRGEVPKVERIVEEETEAFLTWWRSRGVAPTIKALRRRARLIRDAEVDKALRRLGPLSPQEERAVRSLADSLLNKILHEPTVRLKAQAAEGNGAGYAEVLEELFGLAEAEEDGQT